MHGIGQTPSSIKTSKYETSMAFNWFFSGHKNKLTSEISHFGFHDKNLPLAAGWRFRLQWDISL